MAKLNKKELKKQLEKMENKKKKTDNLYRGNQRKFEEVYQIINDLHRDINHYDLELIAKPINKNIELSKRKKNQIKLKIKSLQNKEKLMQKKLKLIGNRIEELGSQYSNYAKEIYKIKEKLK